MIRLRDVTRECREYGELPRERGPVPDLIVVHRFGPGLLGFGLVEDAVDMARAFGELRELRSIGRMAYQLVVLPCGEVQQAVPLRFYTPHARSYNRHSVAVAALGDFREAPPPEPQHDALVSLCAILKAHYRHADLVGHTDLVDATSEVGKECPGKALDVGALHIEATRLMHSREMPGLRALGMRF
jgi:hypothetical protein